MLITLWNPASTHKASLPSCLMMYQFYVNTNAKTLNCQIYLRSSDYFLANNWNTCTGALLTHMICNLEDINLTPGELTVVTGDTHIYKTHLEQVNENLDRKPHPFPKLVIKEQKKDLTEFTFDDLRLVGYRTQKIFQHQWLFKNKYILQKIITYFKYCNHYHIHILQNQI